MQGLCECQACPFYGPKVGSKGPVDSPFMIIGESPGKQELKRGEPFVGDSGELLDFATAQNELPWPIYYSNALQCFPGSDDPEKKKEKMATAVQACRERLLREITAHPRKVILAVGSAAAMAVTGEYNIKITKARGQRVESPLAEHVILTVHPAFLLRGGGSLRQFMADVHYAERLALGDPIRRPGSTTWEILNPYTLGSLALRLRNDPRIRFVAADIETTGLDHVDHEAFMTGFTYDGKHVYFVPEELLPYMDVLFQNDKAFVWHNGKFDVKFCWKQGSPHARVDEDTLLMSYCLDEQRGIHDLEQVAGDWLNSPNWKGALKPHLALVKPKNADPKRSYYEFIPRSIMYQYAAYDIANTFNLVPILRPKIFNDTRNTLLYTKTLIPGTKYLANVEVRGAPLDQTKISSNKRRLGKELRRYRRQLRRMCRKAGGPVDFNPNSFIQVAELLYDRLCIKSKTRSTDKDDLAHLNHPAVTLLLKYRKVAKARSTYVLVLDDTKDERAFNKVSSDGMVHTTFKQHGTPTGRLASSEPNMQNIPREPNIRGQFHAREGRIFAEVDLNQAELRSLAELSRDKVLHKIYTSKGMSLHEVTRAGIYDVPDNWSAANISKWLDQFGLTEITRWIEKSGGEREDRIISEQKMRAKAVNFGIVYGREPPSLAEEFEIDIKEATRWVAAWSKTYPQAWEFIQVCRSAPAKNKNLVTPFGRRKRSRVINVQRLKALQNEAANFPHQSIAADITTQGGILTWEQLIELYDTYVWNTVHDSNLLDCPEDPIIVEASSRLMANTLEKVPPNWGLKTIPFIAEIKVGKRWGSMQDLDKWLKAQKEVA